MSRYHTYNKRRIHYHDQGKGDTVVLIHGYLETSEIWDSYAWKLAEKFRVITIDLPGHGKSDHYEQVYTMEFMAGAIAHLLKSLAIDKSFVTGHSLGGYVTLAFAELYPEILSGYCLFHSQPFADSPEKTEKRNAEINLVLKGGKDLFIPESIEKLYASSGLHKFSDSVKRSTAIALNVPGETIINVLRGMIARLSRVSVMESGKIPLLWTLGAKDNLINCTEIQSKVKLPANAEIKVLENSGHMGFIEEEKLSLEILSGFVKKLI